VRKYINLPVKIGKLYLTQLVKMGYNRCMFGEVVSFILRIGLVVALWGFVWSLVKPRTRLMRVVRAALLVVGLLGVLAVLRVAGTN